jgi:hypothetical protein
MQSNVPPISESSMAAFAQQLLTAASNINQNPFGATPQNPYSISAPSNSATPSQKDFAIALGVSQARISQLVKIGMPLSSIAAAKEWRVKRQRSNDDAALDAAESGGSPDPVTGTVSEGRIQSIGAAASNDVAQANTVPSAPAARLFAAPVTRQAVMHCFHARSALT